MLRRSLQPNELPVSQYSVTRGSTQHCFQAASRLFRILRNAVPMGIPDIMSMSRHDATDVRLRLQSRCIDTMCTPFVSNIYRTWYRCGHAQPPTGVSSSFILAQSTVILSQLLLVPPLTELMGGMVLLGGYV